MTRDRIPTHPSPSLYGNHTPLIVINCNQSFIETIENVEAAADAGDAYNMKEACIVDGAGTCVEIFAEIFAEIAPRFSPRPHPGAITLPVI